MNKNKIIAFFAFGIALALALGIIANSQTTTTTTTAPSDAQVAAAKISLQAASVDVSVDDLINNLDIVMNKAQLTDEEKTTIVNKLSQEVFLKAENGDSEGKLMQKDNAVYVRMKKECVTDNSLPNSEANKIATKNLLKVDNIIDERDYSQMKLLGSRNADKILITEDGQITLNSGTTFNSNKLGGETVILGGGNKAGGITLESSGTQIRSGILKEVTKDSSGDNIVSVAGKSAKEMAEVAIDAQKRGPMILENAKVHQEPSNIASGSIRTTVQVTGTADYKIDTAKKTAEYIPGKDGKITYWRHNKY
jgi:hypothetical protein